MFEFETNEKYFHIDNIRIFEFDRTNPFETIGNTFIANTYLVSDSKFDREINPFETNGNKMSS